MSHTVGGVREYVTSLTRSLVQLPTPHRWTIYYDTDACVGQLPTAHEVVLQAPHKLIWDHVLIPLRVHHDQPDVIWFPQNTISLGITIPTVVSVTDLLYFSIPEFPYREYAWLDTVYARAMMPLSLHTARRIMTISQHTAGDISRILGIARDKMTTIYLAPAARYRPLQTFECMPTRERYQLTRPFFFYAGVLSPRKNVRLLIEAFGRVAAQIPHDLILTGSPGYLETPFDDLIKQYGIEGRVRRLGRVADEDMVALYNLAEAFVFPSLYEGFGVPPLEAFACGCPVICSQSTSLPEVVGTAALTFDPHNVHELAAHLYALATTPALRTDLVRRGFARVAAFHYDRSARSLLSLLEDAAV
jgi:glycosyltransferase involved in cell wall biosynthesis